MATLNGNIFRQAKELLQSKSIFELNEEELLTVNAAMIPLNMPEFNDKTTDEGLEELAKMFEEAIVKKPKIGEPNWEKCTCPWHLGMGPELHCPVHGRPELAKETK